MPATLKVAHKAIGVEVRRGTYDVVVDGTRAGSVELNDVRDASRTRTSYPANPQRPELEPDCDLRRGRGPGHRLPMQRKEHPANLSPAFVVPSLAISLRRE